MTAREELTPTLSWLHPPRTRLERLKLAADLLQPLQQLLVAHLGWRRLLADEGDRPAGFQDRALHIVQVAKPLPMRHGLQLGFGDQLALEVFVQQPSFLDQRRRFTL